MWILDFLVRLPEPVAYLLLVAIGIGVGQALIWAVDRAIPRWRRERVNELLGMLLAVVAVVYAVPLGLVAVEAWGDFTEARSAVTQEATQIARLADAARSLPEPMPGQSRRLKAYAQTVIEHEWRQMTAKATRAPPSRSSSGSGCCFKRLASYHRGRCGAGQGRPPAAGDAPARPDLEHRRGSDPAGLVAGAGRRLRDHAALRPVRAGRDGPAPADLWAGGDLDHDRGAADRRHRSPVPPRHAGRAGERSSACWRGSERATRPRHDSWRRRRARSAWVRQLPAG